MKRTYGFAISALLLAGAVVLTNTVANAAEDQGDKSKDAAAAALCPVMGEPIDLSYHTRTDEGPVFFCCSMCINRYDKNPEKYAAKVSDQRKVMADRDKIQTLCPVSGKPVVKGASIEQDGDTVQFCCQGCVAKYKQDPAKYAAGLANSYTYQTKCPVSGARIDPASATELPTGETIYFCCEKCSAAFLADPAKHAPNLEAQGLALNVKKLQEALKKE